MVLAVWPTPSSNTGYHCLVYVSAESNICVVVCLFVGLPAPIPPILKSMYRLEEGSHFMYCRNCPYENKMQTAWLLLALERFYFIVMFLICLPPPHSHTHIVKTRSVGENVGHSSSFPSSLLIWGSKTEIYKAEDARGGW